MAENQLCHPNTRPDPRQGLGLHLGGSEGGCRTHFTLRQDPVSCLNWVRIRSLSLAILQKGWLARTSGAQIQRVSSQQELSRFQSQASSPGGFPLAVTKGLHVQDVLSNGLKPLAPGPFLVSIIYSPIKINDKLKLDRRRKKGGRERKERDREREIEKRTEENQCEWWLSVY